jgi:hypothetical protein
MGGCAMAKMMIATGLLIAAAGVLFWLMEGRTGWFGHLPGDVRVERPGFKIFFPLTTLILLSLLLNLILWFMARFRQ